jgi:hypothetical protein
VNPPTWLDEALLAFENLSAMRICSLLPGPWLSIVGLALDLVGTLLTIAPLFFISRRLVIRGDLAPFWSQKDDPEAKLLRRQLSWAPWGAGLLTLGVSIQALASWCKG